MTGAALEIDRLRCLAERLAGLAADLARFELRREAFDGRCSGLDGFGPECSRLHGDEAWACAGLSVVGVELALEQLAHEDRRRHAMAMTSLISTCLKRVASAGAKSRT